MQKDKLIYFGSEGCTQCRAIKDELTSLDYVDYGNDYESYNISVLPTLVLTRNGQEVKRLTGFHTKEQILEWLFN